MALLLAAGYGLWCHRAAVVTRSGRRVAVLVGGLALLGALSLLGKPFDSSGWGYVVGLAGYAVAGLAACWAVGRLPRGEVVLARGAALFWTFLVADSLLQWAIGRDLFGVPYAPEQFEGRLLGPFPETLKMPVLVAILFPFAAWPWRSRPWLVVALFVIAAWVVLLSGARSSLVLLALAALPLFWPLPKRWWVVAVGGVVALGGIALTFSPALQSRWTQFVRYADVAIVCNEAVECNAARNAVLSNRWELWRNAARMVEHHPWFGVGMKRFEVAYPEVAEPTDLYVRERPFHSHNLYTDVAAELGLVGLGGFGVGIGFLGYWYWRAFPTARERAGPWAAALAAYLWPIQSQPVLLKVWWFPVVFFLLVGYLVALDASLAEAERADDGA